MNTQRTLVIDTNVLLEIILHRKLRDPAAFLLQAAEQGQCLVLAPTLMLDEIAKVLAVNISEEHVVKLHLEHWRLW